MEKTEIINKCLNSLKELNELEKEKLKLQGFTNECFFIDNELTEDYEFKVIVKSKYVYINAGNSGVFMICLEDLNTKHYGLFEKGSIFNIKSYGTPDFHKYLGNIRDIDLKFLYSKRYNYLR